MPSNRLILLNEGYPPLEGIPEQLGDVKNNYIRNAVYLLEGLFDVTG